MTAQDTSTYRPSDEEDYMGATQIAYFQKKLLDQHAALTTELKTSPGFNSGEGESRGDQTDQATTETDRDIGTLNAEQLELLLNQVEQALARIGEGTYGFSEGTGEPIGLHRLEAQPTATLTVAEQEQLEKSVR